jgi:hypothetical protein
MRLPIVVCLLALFFPSCAFAQEPPTPTAAPPAAAGAPVPFSTVVRGADLAFSAKPLEVVARDDAAWKDLWQRMHAGFVPAPPLPSIDFERDVAVAVFAGERPTAGYAIEVAAAERAGPDLVLTIREKRPPPGAILAQTITHPYHVVRVPRPPGEVRFRRE